MERLGTRRILQNGEVAFSRQEGRRIMHAALKKKKPVKIGKQKLYIYLCTESGRRNRERKKQAQMEG